MIRSLSIFALFPFLLLGSVSNQVASIVNTCDNHLQSASIVLQLAKNDCENCLDNLYQFADINPSSVSSPAASNFYYAVTNCSSAIVNIDRALDQINRARGSLNTIPALADGMVTNIIVTVTNVTLVVTTNACEGCSSKLDRILSNTSDTVWQINSLRNELVDFKYEFRDNISSLNSDLAFLKSAVTEISNLVQQARSESHGYYLNLSNDVAGVSHAIDNGGGDSGSGGGGSGSCNCEYWLSQILQVLNNLYIQVEHVRDVLDSWDGPLTNYLGFYNDLQDVISEYYNLLNRRYKDFDHRLPDALSAMFTETFSKLNLVTDRFRLDQHNQAASIQTLLDNIGSGDQQFELSNEGLISLYSAATLDRSYLTQVKIYEALTNMNFATSNYVDLGWLEDYLLQVQQPYFQMFKDRSSFGSAWTLSPYSSGVWPSVSNFFSSSTTDLALLNGRHTTFLKKNTNWFQRVELYLQNLNGLLLPSDKTGELTDSDKEEFEQDFEVSTNQLSNIDYALESVSNQLSQVFAKFTECVEVFSAAQISNDSQIPLFEGGTYFGVEIPHITLDLSDSSSVMAFCVPCRSLMSFLWNALLAISSFWLLCQFVKVVTVVFVRVTSLLVTALSPS